ncbi:MAG TPA: tetratricopeptide repeat protein [Polyangiaceae bacterium]|nr:tetratricopeptide repeat protein [Polyangiaceae bacterium]
MDDHGRQLLLLGREHFDRGEYEKAEYLLRQLMPKAERFADVHHMLGIIAHHAGDFKQAEQHFEKAIQINPSYTEAQLNLVVTYNELGNYDAARRLYALIRSRTQEQKVDRLVRGRISNLHAQVSQAYLDAGMLLDAASELEKAVQLSPEFVDLRVRLGLLYRDLGELTRARSELETARNTNPKYVHAHLSLGTLLLGAGELEAARREFEAVLAIEPEHKMAATYLRLVRSPLRTSPPPSAPPTE